MPYALLPGSRSTFRNSHSVFPVVIAALVIVVGGSYFALGRNAPSKSSEAVQPQVPVAPTTVQSEHRRDDLVLHLAHIRANVQEATDHIVRSRRLTDAAARSLDATPLVVETRRVHAATDAATAALSALSASIEEIEVSFNSLRKDN